MVRHPGACAVVAFTPANEVLLVRQFREAVRELLLEVPAGVFDVAGESGERCAARELLEETGYRATTMESLGWFYTSPGFTDERFELFVARAHPTDRPPEDDLELVPMPIDDCLVCVSDGRISDSKTALSLLLAKDHRILRRS